MADWYDNGLEKMFAEFVEETDLSLDQAKRAYGFLSNIGIVDYDIEKEVIRERYDDEADDE